MLPISEDDSQYVSENIRDLLRTIFLATAQLVTVAVIIAGAAGAAFLWGIYR